MPSNIRHRPEPMHSIDEPTPALHTDTVDPLHDSVGRQLRVARETANITLAQIAAELHLSVSTITALEDDHYEGLPSEVFVIGYLRAYARTLGLDPAPLLDQYRRVQPADSHPTMPVARARADNSRSFAIPLAPLIGLLLALVLGGAGWFGWTQLGGSDFFANLLSAPDADDTGVISPTPRVARPVLPRPPADVDPEAALNPEGRPLDEASADAAAEALDTEPELEPEPSGTAPESDSPPADDEPADADMAGLIASIGADSDENDTATEGDGSEASATAEVIMTFSGPCWVDVRDATGEYKLFGEMNKGDRETLGGRGPYSIILGNAAAVAVTVDGKEFDVETVARGNVARFDLDPAVL